MLNRTKAIASVEECQPVVPILTRHNFNEAPCFWGSMYGEAYKLSTYRSISHVLSLPFIGNLQYQSQIHGNCWPVFVCQPTTFFEEPRNHPPRTSDATLIVGYNQLTWRISKVFRSEFISSLYRWNAGSSSTPSPHFGEITCVVLIQNHAKIHFPRHIILGIFKY